MTKTSLTLLRDLWSAGPAVDRHGETPQAGTPGIQRPNRPQPLGV
ncbi:MULTISPECIES: hypothetical protein [Microcoleaceae]|nr:hypothetical protein [Tychonema sp. LEGE 06208]